MKVNPIINKNIRVTFFKYFKETHNNFYFCNIIENFNNILNPSSPEALKHPPVNITEETRQVIILYTIYFFMWYCLFVLYCFSLIGFLFNK